MNPAPGADGLCSSCSRSSETRERRPVLGRLASGHELVRGGPGMLTLPMHFAISPAVRWPCNRRRARLGPTPGRLLPALERATGRSDARSQRWLPPRVAPAALMPSVRLCRVRALAHRVLPAQRQIGRRRTRHNHRRAGSAASKRMEGGAGRRWLELGQRRMAVRPRTARCVEILAGSAVADAGRSVTRTSGISDRETTDARAIGVNYAERLMTAKRAEQGQRSRPEDLIGITSRSA